MRTGLQWQQALPSEREVKKALCKALFKYKLHQDEGLFEKAFQYIRSTTEGHALKKRAALRRGLRLYGHFVTLRMAKTGRNEPCPCGSGKKFKRCHGAVSAQSHVPSDFAHRLSPLEAARGDVVRKQAEAKRVQKQRQQGLGSPIISAGFAGGRVVAVKNRVLFSEKWKTFHDFLFDYIRNILGASWGQSEIEKPEEQRHPIVRWYQTVCLQQAASIRELGVPQELAGTGETSAYYTLAYDLYCLDHNAELQAKLVKRLQNQDQFWGARNEVFVAAALIRAGFTVEFEDEDDRSGTHCEFTATSKRSGRKFSVEAKHRGGNKFRLGRRLYDALRKNANHERLIFIELNEPNAVPSQPKEIPPALQRAVEDIDAFAKQRPSGNQLPAAYVFVTNNVGHYPTSTGTLGRIALMHGFKIPDFRWDLPVTLREAIASNERHQELFDIGQSIQDHSFIPSTFDGEIPEFAFGETTRRLLIGSEYRLLHKGDERVAVLDTGFVDPEKRVAICALRIPATDEAFIQTVPLTDAEMAAWERHPDTFFGVVEQRKRTADDPVELFEFFLNSYRDSPKETLLGFLAGAPDIEHLRQLDQPALAKEYAIRLVENLLANAERPRIAQLSVTV